MGKLYFRVFPFHIPTFPTVRKCNCVSPAAHLHVACRLLTSVCLPFVVFLGYRTDASGSFYWMIMALNRILLLTYLLTYLLLYKAVPQARIIVYVRKRNAFLSTGSVYVTNESTYNCLHCPRCCCCCCAEYSAPGRMSAPAASNELYTYARDARRTLEASYRRAGAR